MAKRSVWKSLGNAAWIFAILAIPVGAFLLHAFGQLRQVELRNTRNLGKAAESIEELVGNAQATLRSLTRDRRFACEFVSRQTRLELVEPGSCFDLEPNDGEGNDVFAHWRPTVREHDRALQLVLQPPTASNGERSEAATDPDRSGAEASAAGPVGPPPTVPEAIVFNVRLDALLEEIPFGRGLDLILIVDEAGRIVSQLDGRATGPQDVAAAGDRSPVRISRLEELVPDEEGELPAPRRLASTSVESVSIAGTGYQLLCQPLVIPGLPASGTAPGRDEPGAEVQPAPWALCGLVEKERSLRGSLAIAPQYVSGLVLLVLLALFTWPFLKIASMTPRERFRFADVYFLLLGSWGALMLATFVVITYDTHLKLRGVAEESLETLAAEVADNLTGELTDWHRQLTAFDDRLTQDYFPGRSGQDDVTHVVDPEAAVPSWARPAIDPYFGSAFWMRPCDGRQFLKLTVRDANTPKVSVAARDYFRRVQSGDLWRLPDCPSCRFFAQSFRSVTTGEFAAALSLPSGIPAVHAFDATGEPTRLRMKDIFPDCDPDQVAAAISGNPVSISFPVLPPGYGFAVVGPDGTVLFHSDGRRAVFENLYEEIEDADYVAAAVSAGTTLHLQTSYGAVPHDVFVRPMAGPPWTVVAFLDSQLLRTQHIETLLLGGFYILVHLGIYFLLTIAFIVVRGRATPVWLWPYLSFRPLDYAWLTWLLLIATLATALAVRMLGASGALVFSALAPLTPVAALTISPWVLRAKDDTRLVGTVCLVGATAAVGLMLALLLGAFGASLRGGEPVVLALGVALWVGGIAAWFHFRSEGGRSRVEWGAERRLRYSRLGHMTAAIVIWMLIAVVPAWGYARFAVVEQLLVLARHENVQSLLSLRARNEAVEDYYRGADLPPTFLDERRSLEARDVYWSGLFWRAASTGTEAERCPRASPEDAERDESLCPGFAIPARSASPPECTSSLSARIRCLVRAPARAAFPIYNDTAGQMRYLEASGSALGQWRIGSDPKALSYAPAIAGLEQPRVLRSELPITGPALGWTSLVAAVVLAILLVYWVRYGAMRLFFGNVSPAPTEPYFATLFAGATDTEPHGAPGVGRGLRSPATAEWLGKNELAVWPAELRAKHAEALQELEHGLSRREALERLMEIGGVYYRSLWLSCSTDEKIVLTQLTKEGVANPKQEGAVRQLLRKGLLVRDPVLRIMNRSFALFVLHEHEPSELASLERPEEGIGWKQVKWVLLAVLAVVAAFLWTTQPSFVENAVKYLTAAAAAVGVLMKLVSATDRLTGSTSQQ